MCTFGTLLAWLFLLADSEGEAPPVLLSSSATRLLAASMHDDCILKERGHVGLGKMVVFLKYASRAIVTSILFTLHLCQLPAARDSRARTYVRGRPAVDRERYAHRAPIMLIKFREKYFRE